ncbi:MULTISPECIES: universal stress protein [Haloprofundus]|uniref:universal stress protein n=1 Tax=Haloprofundus TaxID=1911573 RepID=UPI000E42D617|nr:MULTISPECIES: universal stress protein [Haloprofundus]QCJ45667.1 universal stress protein [Haloprofundus sp. MHR1]
MKVLLGIGGSEDSYQALERTVERAVAAADDLTVAIVENPDSDATPEEIETHVRERLEGVAFDAEIRHVEGDPGSRLVDLAESGGFDQVVLGGGQRSPMGKISIGSIAEFVLLNSHKTVKLVR